MTNNVWKVLVIDDDEGIHSITKMVFRDYEFDHKSIALIHAYSAAQAQQILIEQPDIAVILLDVVMETDDAGLMLINYIRRTLKQDTTRIILRTGHPGFAPEADIIMQYDINDYLSKAELSASRLTTSVTVAIRSFRDIQHLTNKNKATPEVGTEQKKNSDTTLLAQAALQLGNTISTISQQSSKLQLFSHKPMISDVINSLNHNCEKLSSQHSLLQPFIGQEQSETQLISVLNHTVKLYMDQARLENWIIDYQISANTPTQIIIDRQWLQTLLTTMIELVIDKYSHDNIIVKIDYAKNRVSIDIQGDQKPANNTNQFWQLHLQNKLDELAVFYDGETSLDKPKSSVHFSFAL